MSPLALMKKKILSYLGIVFKSKCTSVTHVLYARVHLEKNVVEIIYRSLSRVRWVPSKEKFFTRISYVQFSVTFPPGVMSFNLKETLLSNLGIFFSPRHPNMIGYERRKIIYSSVQVLQVRMLMIWFSGAYSYSNRYHINLPAKYKASPAEET